MDPQPHRVVDEILAPILPLLAQEAQTLRPDATTYTLSFHPFTVNLLFGLISGLKSISLLVTDIQTSPVARALDLVVASKSMYSEAFRRYSPRTYRALFYTLLERMNFLEIPEIRALGRFCCIDGSVFPALITMAWAVYQDKHNALKLHLAFELNRMIPTQFVSTAANTSERKILRQMLEAGVTYIADRGYVSFQLFYDICAHHAHFIIRGTANLVMTTYETLPVDIPAAWAHFFTALEDRKIRFANDPHQHDYRVVAFVARGESFALLTNRFDLRTSEIIMLYAYRWQVELIFRFLKRTMHGLHFLCQHPSGLEIQFTLYMIAYLLLLQFKQRCAPGADEPRADGARKPAEGTDKAAADSSLPLPRGSLFYGCGLVSVLGERVRQYWKMGIHWLTTVRNSLLQPFTPDMARLIWTKQ